MPIQRILEPEVMDTVQDAAEYDGMDFAEVNANFAERAVILAPPTGLVLDVGTGTARIPIAILQAAGKKELAIHAIDLSAEMLNLARKNIDNAGLSNRIMVHHLDAKKLPFDDGAYDMLISNSIVHHIPKPLGLFKELKRIVKKDGGMLIRDLLRPDSEQHVDALVKEYAGNDNDYQRKLFRDSLLAALTIPEIKALLSEAGLDDVTVVQSSDRHWSIERASRL